MKVKGGSKFPKNVFLKYFYVYSKENTHKY